MFVTLKFITGGEQQVALPGLRIVNDPVHGTVALIPEVGGPKAYALDMSHEGALGALREAYATQVETHLHGKLAKKLDVVVDRLDTLEEQVDRHAQSIALIPQYIKDVNARYEAFEDGLTKKILARRRAGRDKISQLGGRVALLEAVIEVKSRDEKEHTADIFGALDKFSERIAELERKAHNEAAFDRISVHMQRSEEDRAAINDLETRLRGLSRQIAAIEAKQVGVSGAQIFALELESKKATEKLAAQAVYVDKSIGYLENRLGSLQESLDALSERLGQTNQNVSMVADAHNRRLKKLEEGGAVVRCLSSSPDVDKRIDKLSAEVRQRYASLTDSLFRRRGWTTECIHKLQDELKAVDNSLLVTAQDHGDLHARTGELEDRLIALEKKAESCPKGPAYPQPGPWRELEGAKLVGDFVLVKPKPYWRTRTGARPEVVPSSLAAQGRTIFGGIHNYIYMEIPE